MEPTRLDTLGMRCPQPVLKLAAAIAGLPKDSLIDVIGDCPTFEQDIRTFCERRKKTLLWARREGTAVVIRVQT